MLLWRKLTPFRWTQGWQFTELSPHACFASIAWIWWYVNTGTGNKTEKQKLCADNITGGSADFLRDIYIIDVENALIAGDKACQEVNKYRKMTVSANPLVWWRKMKKQSFAECDSQTVFLHTCDIYTLWETFFSIARDIVTAQRASLKSKHVDNINNN